MTKLADFIADLKYRTAEQGGRDISAFSKYRPQTKFPFSEMQTSGQQTFIGVDVVHPGESVRAEIAIIAVEYFAGKLEVGMPFDFREGARIIGTGVILEILNPLLKKNKL